MKMLPEHEAFLLEHVRKMGFIFIVDRLKVRFPTLSHGQACAIYHEFKTKHAEDAEVKKADASLKDMGKKIGDDFEKLLRKRIGD